VNVVLALVAIFWLFPQSRSSLSRCARVVFGSRVGGPCSRLRLNSPLATTHDLFPGVRHGRVLDSLITSLEITIPATILVALISSLRLQPRVRLLARSRHDLLGDRGVDGRSASSGAHSRRSVLSELGNLFGLNPYGTIPGVIIFHVAFGLRLASFSCATSFRHPKGLLERRIEGAGEWKSSTASCCPSASGDRVAGDISVHLGVERPVGRAGVSRGNVHSPLTSSLRPDTVVGGELLDRVDRCRRVHFRTADRLLLLPALLRPWRLRCRQMSEVNV